MEDAAHAMFNRPVVDIGMHSDAPMVARGFAEENELNHTLVKEGHVLCVPPQYTCYESWWEVFAFVCENVLSHPALVAPNGRIIADVASGIMGDPYLSIDQ